MPDLDKSFKSRIMPDTWVFASFGYIDEEDTCGVVIKIKDKALNTLSTINGNTVS